MALEIFIKRYNKSVEFNTLHFTISFKISTDLYSHESSQRCISCAASSGALTDTAAVWSDLSEYGNSPLVNHFSVFCFPKSNIS